MLELAKAAEGCGVDGLLAVTPVAGAGIRLPLVTASRQLAAEIEQMLAGDVGELIDA